MPGVNFRCPVESCKCHMSIIFAEISQIKNHLSEHDYRELLEIAFNLGIISSLSERRSPKWLIDELFHAGKMMTGVALS